MIFFFPHISFAQGIVYEKGYFRKDGFYVPSHFRTKPDKSPYNNFSFSSNYNSYTKKIAPRNLTVCLANYHSAKYEGKSLIAIDINTQCSPLNNSNVYNNNLHVCLE